MKRLRGTPFDVFGWDPDRRIERAVIDEYEQLVTATLAPAASMPYDAHGAHRRIRDVDQGLRADQGARHCPVA